MTPSTKKQTGFRLESELLEALQAVKERDGIPLTEQVRRAVREWLKARGVDAQKAERKRAVTRRRP